MESAISGAVRFDILVNGSAYRSLVNGLRSSQSGGGPGARTRVPRTHVRAQIEFDLRSKQFSLLTIGSHKLPKSLSVQPGTETHKSLALLLAQQAERESQEELRLLVRRIVDSVPQLPAQTLTVLRRDIAVRDSDLLAAERPSSSSSSTMKLTHVIAPTLSLELDDSPTLILPEASTLDVESAIRSLTARTRLIAPLTVTVSENTAHFEVTIRVPKIFRAEAELFLHWGSYDELASSWRDELIERIDISGSQRVYTLQHTVRIPQRGYYGATLFIQIAGSSHAIWLAQPWQGDTKFCIAHDDLDAAQKREQLFTSSYKHVLQTLTSALRNNEPLDNLLPQIRSSLPHVGLGQIIKDVAEQSQVDTSVIESINRNPWLSAQLANYGIGEVVFTTPEGPHAAAGGLAQVISGLPPELAQAGIPVTIISPLYAHQNGSKHHCARRILEKGFSFGGKTAIPVYVGSVDVHLGPTYHSGTTEHRRQATTIPVAVYLAEFDCVRFFLLANSSVFDRLYQPVYADEQLRRAVVLSRATLEVVATSHFCIRPCALVSNDWMTACVPPFAALDPRYQAIPWIRSCKTIHMIHNGGADYHGRLPVNLNNEDLWPMLNLRSEHFFGFRDPHREELLNFTMAAATHVSGALLTVSQPYADQISSPGGGDGLEYVLQHKKGAVFGISNGINRTEIDRFIAHLANKNITIPLSTDEIIAAKALTKIDLQKRYGLLLDPNARLLSCVGRMVEQKGLSLLSGFVTHGNHSALEDVLLRHPDAQILLAGPLTSGDRCASDLAAAVGYLMAKYPGRITAHFDFIPHSEALRIIFGSTCFLMPSRFEPGGITQLEALAAGTLVIGRNVGGISATITNFDISSKCGNGFLCNDYTPTAYANTTSWALDIIRCTESYRTLVQQALRAKHSWNDRVPAYQALLQRTIRGAVPQHSDASISSS